VRCVVGHPVFFLGGGVAHKGRSGTFFLGVCGFAEGGGPRKGFESALCWFRVERGRCLGVSVLIFFVQPLSGGRQTLMTKWSWLGVGLCSVWGFFCFWLVVFITLFCFFLYDIFTFFFLYRFSVLVDRKTFHLWVSNPGRSCNLHRGQGEDLNHYTGSVRRIRGERRVPTFPSNCSPNTATRRNRRGQPPVLPFLGLSLSSFLF